MGARLGSSAAASAAAPAGAFDERVEELLSRIYGGLETMKELNEPFDVSRDELSLTIDLGEDTGAFILRAQRPSVYLQSPVSGTHIYEFDEQHHWWASKADSHILLELLARELLRVGEGGFPDF